jgi:hypothetical protein
MKSRFLVPRLSTLAIGLCFGIVGCSDGAKTNTDTMMSGTGTAGPTTVAPDVPRNAGEYQKKQQALQKNANPMQNMSKQYLGR